MPTTARTNEDNDPESSRFGFWLLVVIGGALALRIAYLLGYTAGPDRSLYDSFYYLWQSDSVANGHGFVKPATLLANADHPPLTTLVITPATWLFGIDSTNVAQKLTMCFVGTGTVGAVGLLGRAVAGFRVGLISAVVAAMYPNLLMNDGIVMSESLTALLVALALYATYRVRRSRSTGALLGLGVVCGLAALTRAELILLLPALAIPGVLGSNRALWRPRLGSLAIVVVTASVVISPWVVRNLLTFDEPVLLSNGAGIVLLGANCDPVYGGPQLGTWDSRCLDQVKERDDPAVQERRQRAKALDYIRHRLERLPTVVAARIGRTWGAYRPFQTVDYSESEGRPPAVALAGLIMFWLLVPLALLGVRWLRRGLRPVWPLLVPFGIVTIVSAMTYGSVRFRVPAEPALVVLAAVGLESWRGSRRASRAGDRPAVAVHPRSIDASSSS